MSSEPALPYPNVFEALELPSARQCKGTPDFGRGSSMLDMALGDARPDRDGKLSNSDQMLRYPFATPIPMKLWHSPGVAAGRPNGKTTPCPLSTS